MERRERLVEQLLIPPGVERDLVIREPQRVGLLPREVPQANDGYLGLLKLLGREETPVTGDHRALCIDEHGVTEPELLDRLRDLLDLLRRVRARVARVGRQLGDRDLLDS